MAVVAADVMRRAAAILNDAQAVRWTPAELLDWLNDGLQVLALHSPQAFVGIIEIDMVEGTVQTAPEASVISILRGVRNLEGSGLSITNATTDTLDRLVPGWRNPWIEPWSPRVRHVVLSASRLDTFEVYPGNDGSGRIEVVAKLRPKTLAAPEADAADLAAYLDLDPVCDRTFLPALVDYVAHRGFQKDAEIPGAAARANAHFQAFLLGAGVQGLAHASLVETPETP